MPALPGERPPSRVGAGGRGSPVFSADCREQSFCLTDLGKIGNGVDEDSNAWILNILTEIQIFMGYVSPFAVFKKIIIFTSCGCFTRENVCREAPHTPFY